MEALKRGRESFVDVSAAHPEGAENKCFPYPSDSSALTETSGFSSDMKKALLILGVVMTTTVTHAAGFKVGQVWEYKTRAVEVGSTLTIVKIDNVENERIIHISVQGLSIKNPKAPKGYNDKIAHLPISEKSLTESVTKMLRVTEELPDFQEGYNLWKDAQGGYFTLPVSQCVEYMEQVINQ